jgi:hypothetical protein
MVFTPHSATLMRAGFSESGYIPQQGSFRSLLADASNSQSCANVVKKLEERLQRALQYATIVPRYSSSDNRDYISTMGSIERTLAECTELLKELTACSQKGLLSKQDKKALQMKIRELVGALKKAGIRIPDGLENALQSKSSWADFLQNMPKFSVQPPSGQDVVLFFTAVGALFGGIAEGAFGH